MSTPVETPPKQPETVPLKPITAIEPGDIFGAHEEQPPSSPPASPPSSPPANPPAETPPANALDALFGKPSASEANTPADPPAEKPPTDEPSDADTPSRLRQALSTQKEQFQNQIQGIESERDTLRTENEALREQLKTARREASLIDPSKSPEVVAASSALDSKVKDVARTLKPQLAREFMKNGHPLIAEYGELGEVYDDGYDDRYNALRAKIDKDYGASADEVMRSLPELSQLAAAVKDKVRAASSSNEDSYYEQMQTTHTNASTYLDRIFETTLSFDENLNSQSPLAPQNIVAKMVETMPEFKASTDQLREYLRKTLIPPKPLTKAQLQAMTPEQRQQAQASSVKAYSDGYNRIYDTIPLAMHAMAALPVVAKILQDTRAELADARSLLPPGASLKGAHRTPETPGPASPPPTEGGVRPISLDEINR